MHIYTTLQEQDMQKMFNQILSEESWSLDAFNRKKVLSSSRDMVFYFSSSRQKCIELSTGGAYFHLYTLFKKFLSRYATQMAGKLEEIKVKVQTEELSLEEDTLLCAILNTSEYCAGTAKEMQSYIVADIDTQYKSQVSLEESVEAFHTLLADTISTLVQSLAIQLNEIFAGMAVINDEKPDLVSDASPYTQDVANQLEHFIDPLRSIISPSHFPFFCESVATHVVELFSAEVYKLSGISEGIAVQLMLDRTALKASIGKSTNPNPSGPASERYTKRVARKFQHIEKVLRTLQTPTTFLLDTFTTSFPDGSVEEFVRLMKMKGVKYTTQIELLDQFGAPADHPARAAIIEGAEVEGTYGERLGDKVNAMKDFFKSF
eukprot:TRINITY_DN2956_c0_g1_i2.p1 TRINITY_DN2956_c0_g1~~TRINITY_DN2956_c0_g1_i2.p1  ORF type:complete len:376 (-),score=72.30 TRINITY_DN2956_c0_g1_i2:6-1133(-)